MSYSPTVYAQGLLDRFKAVKSGDEMALERLASFIFLILSDDDVHFIISTNRKKWGNPPLRCEDCGMIYENFPLDVVIPDEQWAQITGYDDGHGILCAACIVKRGTTLPGITVATLKFE